jgi:hypothetical protein
MDEVMASALEFSSESAECAVTLINGIRFLGDLNDLAARAGKL